MRRYVKLKTEEEETPDEPRCCLWLSEKDSIDRVIAWFADVAKVSSAEEDLALLWDVTDTIERLYPFSEQSAWIRVPFFALSLTCKVCCAIVRAIFSLVTMLIAMPVGFMLMCFLPIPYLCFSWTRPMVGRAMDNITAYSVGVSMTIGVVVGHILAILVSTITVPLFCLLYFITCGGCCCIVNPFIDRVATLEKELFDKVFVYGCELGTDRISKYVLPPEDSATASFSYSDLFCFMKETTTSESSHSSGDEEGFCNRKKFPIFCRGATYFVGRTLGMIVLLPFVLIAIGLVALLSPLACTFSAWRGTHRAYLFEVLLCILLFPIVVGMFISTPFSILLGIIVMLLTSFILSLAFYCTCCCCQPKKFCNRPVFIV